MLRASEEKAALLESYRDDVEWNNLTKESDVPINKPLTSWEAEELRYQQGRLRRRKIHAFLCLILTIYWSVVPYYRQAKYNKCLESLGEHDHHQLPVVPGVVLDECADWKTGNGSGEAAVSSAFDLDAENPLYFASRGSFAHGSVKVVQSEDDDTGVKATVTVETGVDEASRPWRGHFLDIIRVCRIRKDDGSGAMGVGIFTPQWEHEHQHHHYHNVNFQVTIELPKSEGPLTIGSFETDMPIFSHSLETGEGAVAYQNLHLKTAMARVEAVDATAENLTVFTADASIDGNFTASKSISLRTTNAHINVVLELESSSSTNATSTILGTSNGAITARNTLTATNWSESNTGNFSVVASTANARIGLSFPFAQVNSTLTLDAFAALGSIDAALHPTYEGNFFLTTQLSKAEVIASRDEVDPEDRDRERSSETRQTRSEVSGETWWGNYGGEREHWGKVTLKSALGPVALRFGSTDA